MRIWNRISGCATAGAAFLTATLALAQDNIQGLETIGKPIQDGLNFQPAATELARDILWYDTILLYFITAIVVFVTGLMIFVFMRYNKRANPKPATFTHNTPIEIIWTVVPALSLVVLAVFFALPVLLKQLRIPEADVTIKAIGNQWYWSYEYPDHEFGFDSLMLEREELEEYGYAADEYLLATDNAVVVPVNKTIVMQVTGADVIHAWKIPAFGVHMDAVPGRLAEIWFTAEQEGIYFGQCSELCGKDHAYMPITVKVVSEAVYAEWLEGAVEEFAGDPSTLPGAVFAAAE